MGNYIVDFYCPAKKLIIEIDGGQHCEDEATRTDQKRDEYLLKLGFRVLRFDNLEVIKNKEGVLLRTLEELNPPHPSF